MTKNLKTTSPSKFGESDSNKEVKEIIYGYYEWMPIKEILYTDGSHEIWNFSHEIPYEPLVSCAYKIITKGEFDELVKYSVKEYRFLKIREKENPTKKEIELAKKLEKEYWTWVEKK